MRITAPLIIIILFLNSCQQKLYFPDRANAPLLSEAHELKLTAAGKVQSNYSDTLGSGSGASMNVELAFAPVAHIGITAAWRHLNRRRIDEEIAGMVVKAWGGVFTGNRWEGAIGYFDKFGRMGRAEVYLGYGNGEIHRRGYYTPARDFDTRYHRYFLQADAGAGNHIFTAGGGFRYSIHKYYDFTSPTTSDLRYQILDPDGPPQDIEAETFAFLEPFIQGEAGWKLLKLNIQAGWALQFAGGRIGGNTPFYWSIGGTLHLLPSWFRNGNIWGRPIHNIRLPGPSENQQ